MKNSNFLETYASRLAFLAATLAFLLFIPACLTQRIGLRVFLVVLILLLLCGGGILLFLASRKKAMGVHYFLYDYRRDSVRPLEKLTAETVEDSIDFYLRPYSKDPVALFSDIPKPLRLQLEAEPQFKPLIMYRMLHALSLLASKDIYLIFSSADMRAITYLCHTLADCKDADMADYIHHLKLNATKEQERVCAFFKKNTECFQKRALRYIEQHFEDFYVEKERFLSRK